MNKNVLIIGYEHMGILPEKRAIGRPEKVFPTWFNGWPADEAEVEELLTDNFNYGNGPMVWNCKTKTDVTENLVFNCDSPFIEPAMFNENGEIPGMAKIKSVYDIHDEKYVFPFSVFGSAWIQLKYFKVKGIHLSEKVKEDCRKGLCKIFMHEFLEGHGFNRTWVKYFIEQQSTLLNIPKESFVFADSNYLTPELQQEYGTKGFCKFWWERHPNGLNEAEYNRRVEDLRNPSNKNFYFICLNRRFRWHRTRIMVEIFNKWNDKFLWSHGKPPIQESLFDNPDQNHFSYEDVLIKEGKFPRELYNILPKIIDVDHLVNDTSVRLELQEQAYINVVTETMFTERETMFFSEKVYKPIVAMQPFILLGSYQSLKVLREQGYKTFHPLINEEYDSIEVPEERFQAIVKEIDRISKLSSEEIRELVRQCSDICIYNYHHWLKYNRNRNYLFRDIEFIQEIKNWLYDN